METRREVMLKAAPELDVDIILSGYETCRCGFKSYPIIRDYYTLNFVTGGEGKITIFDKTFPFKKGDMFSLFPLIHAQYEGVSEEPLKLCWFAFSGKQSEQIIKGFYITTENPVLSVRTIETIEKEIILLTDSIYENPALSKFIILSSLYKLLHLIEASIIDEKNSAFSDFGAKLSWKISSYIMHHMAEPLTISDLCAKFYISRSYLWKLLYRETGYSPQMLIRITRITQAAILLRKTDLSIKAIAAAVGIKDAPYFHRIFKTVFNETPDEHRRIFQASNETLSLNADDAYTPLSHT